ncbi:MAG TPA: hypothetical protein VE954_43355 [Oligoflexus sp.]|uniref:hypothetical protein n=1 Tax=Oligoflexus sp. TaxID=1971216 RepID=UPI002D5D0711|nr:hypothetical protein [Oligoflexus sp.]HYX39983.1 hypothetical protein [Oligoflexus sp.]
MTSLAEAIEAYGRQKALEEFKQDLIYGKAFTRIAWDEGKPMVCPIEKGNAVIKLPEPISFRYGEPRTFCTHDFVNVSFAHIRMVCKHCNVEQL